MKAYKTPLRYPGGKSRAVQKLFAYLPNRTYDELREPFLGGGSFAIEWSKRYPDSRVWVSDLYEPLVNFWGQIQSDGMLLRDELVKLKNLHPNPDRAKDLFLFSKEKVNDLERSSLIRAVAFYVVNKCSFSGLTESSSFSKQASESNFSMRGIDRIPGYSLIIKNWKITNLSYDELLTDDPEVFTYLDPPYDIKDNLYGNKGDMHKRFDHDKFAIDCDQCNGHQLISYNSSQLVKDRFKNWKASEFDLTYTMRSVGQYMQEQQDRKELVLMNYEVE
jgi:site-specific DNA-adenine methylase